MGNEIRSVLDAIAGSWIPKAALIAFVALLAITLVIAMTQNAYTWLDATPPRGIASIDVGRLGLIVGTGGTAAAFLVTLYVADRNYRRGREHIPNLSMELQVVRVPVSQSYDAVIVTLHAKNTGTGLCDVDEVRWTLKALSPYDDEGIDEMQRAFASEQTDVREIEFPWQEVHRESSDLGRMIEPNETEQFTQDFIVPAEITAILVSAWVSNASEPKMTDGWYRRISHELRED